MFRERAFQNNLLLALVAACLFMPAASARGGGGGHCGGGHCGGGGHFGGGSHFSSGAHFSSSHFCTTHASGMHMSFAHISNLNRVTGITSSSVPQANLQHIPEHIDGQIQPIQKFGTATTFSPEVHEEHHAGLLGHLHRFFGGRPKQMQEVQLKTAQTDIIETACMTPLVAAPHVCHQYFAQQNFSLSTVTANSEYLHATAEHFRYLYQPQFNTLFTVSQPLENNYSDAGEDQTIARQTVDNADSEAIDVAEEPVFSGLSYMLPNPGGILSIYFSHEQTINNFLSLNKSSFLTAALHSLP